MAVRFALEQDGSPLDCRSSRRFHHEPRLPEPTMKASTFYRTAAGLLFLFAVAHTVGFSRPDPAWGVDALVGSMRSLHFDVMGSSLSYWDFFLGAGFTVGVLYLFLAILAWQLGGLPVATLNRMRATT